MYVMLVRTCIRCYITEMHNNMHVIIVFFFFQFEFKLNKIEVRNVALASKFLVSDLVNYNIKSNVQTV